MAQSGFEGFEKRLELHFYGDDPMGLRRLGFDALKEVLDAVQCSVVSAVGNEHLDSYVLSESSLFMYPNKMIIKTCGTTQLLKSIPYLLGHAVGLGLTVCGCKYTRGSFIFPEAQPFPHTSFSEEVAYLDECLPTRLGHRKALIMPSSTAHSWHVYTACDHQLDRVHHLTHHNMFTIEVCMTQLDPTLAKKFFRHSGDCTSGDATGKVMTAATGIGGINPAATICDFTFDPCGYSMNGVDGPNYSTIHVTPEEGYSYASYECVGSTDDEEFDFKEVLRKVVGVFGPGTISLSMCTGDIECLFMCNGVADALRQFGLVDDMNLAAEDFPAAGIVTFQTFMMRRSGRD